MKKMLPFLFVLLVLCVPAGCAKNDKENETTLLETVAPDDNQYEVMIPLEDVTAAEQTTNASAAETADAGTVTAKSEPTTAKGTAEAQTASTGAAEITTERRAETETTEKNGVPSTTQKAAETTTNTASQTATKPATGGNAPTAAKPSETTTKSETLTTIDAQRGSYDLPAIPLR